jgi:glycosyltransferase involved in cell wall biosynthesis
MHDSRPLLFLCPRVPWPLNTGAKIRTHALLKALLSEYRVSYAGFLQPDLNEVEALERLADCENIRLVPEQCVSFAGKAWLGFRNLFDDRPATVAKYRHRRIVEFVRSWMDHHPGGVVHADHVHMAPYLELVPDGFKVMDEHNVESQIVERLAEKKSGSPVGTYIRSQAGRMRKLEARMTRYSDLVLAVSEGDAIQLREMAPGTRVEVVPNGVDLEYFHPSVETPRIPGRLVFTGSMNWLPNQDAVIYFMEEIWPILDATPEGNDWSFDIVGHTPPPSVKMLASDRVRVTGSVDDVRPYVHGAVAFIVPIRIGGGSRLKILEAFSMEIPVISTTVGCEGLNVSDGVQLLTADTPEQFSAALVRLAQEPDLGRELASRAKQHVEGHFSWSTIGRKMLNCYPGQAGDSG